MIKFKACFRILLFFTVAVGLTSCDSEADMELTKYINNVKLRKAKPISPLPTFAQLPKFIYPENDARRSPFKPKERVELSDKLAPDYSRPRQPLEAFPLDALKFVGILKEGPIIWGLIGQPGGIVGKVKVGDYMGKNFGQVTQINNNSIKLLETIQVEGKWKKKITILNMNAGE